MSRIGKKIRCLYSAVGISSRLRPNNQTSDNQDCYQQESGNDDDGNGPDGERIGY